MYLTIFKLFTQIKFSDDLAVITYGHWSVLLLFLVAFLFATICLGFLISTLFSTGQNLQLLLIRYESFESW